MGTTHDKYTQDTLQKNGFLALTLTNLDADAESFLQTLHLCSEQWLVKGLKRVIKKKEVHRVVHVDAIYKKWLKKDATRALTKKMNAEKQKMQLLSGKDAIGKNKPRQKRLMNRMIKKLTPRTQEGLATLFDCNQRKNVIWLAIEEETEWDSVDEKKDTFFYINDIFEYVKQGNSAMAQATITDAWIQSGFGFWAHLTPAFSLDVVVKCKQLIYDQMGISTTLSRPPHMIYKPGGACSLPSHHDGIPTRLLINQIHEFLNETDGSNNSWVQRYGFQCLAHINGGALNDGCTYAIGPMTARRLLVCLEAVQALEQEDTANNKSKMFTTTHTYKSFMNSKEAPFFMQWENNFDFFNNKLEEAGLLTMDASGDKRPLGVMPMVPAGDNTQPYLALWPLNFPHGSSPNKTRRITTTVPLYIASNKNGWTTEKGVANHLHSQALVADADADESQWRAAETRLLLRTVPWSTGITHQHPERSAQLIRACKRELNGLDLAEGPFSKLAPSIHQVRSFMDAMDLVKKD